LLVWSIDMSVSFSATQVELIAIAHELENQLVWVDEEGVLYRSPYFENLEDLIHNVRAREHANALVRAFHRFMREHKAMLSNDGSARIRSVRVYHRLVVAACQDFQQVLDR